MNSLQPEAGTGRRLFWDSDPCGQPPNLLGGGGKIFSFLQLHYKGCATFSIETKLTSTQCVCLGMAYVFSATNE